MTVLGAGFTGAMVLLVSRISCAAVLNRRAIALELIVAFLNGVCLILPNQAAACGR